MAQPVALIREAVEAVQPLASSRQDASRQETNRQETNRQDDGILRLFHHHVYEYCRGVRSLFLMTISQRELELLLSKLEARGIPHFVQTLSPAKANLFFGRPAFVAVARSFVIRPLNALTAEEDFMLGTLLGYDSEQQCKRYLVRSGRGRAEELPLAAE